MSIERAHKQYCFRDRGEERRAVEVCCPFKVFLQRNCVFSDAGAETSDVEEVAVVESTSSRGAMHIPTRTSTHTVPLHDRNDEEKKACALKRNISNDMSLMERVKRRAPQIVGELSSALKHFS